MNTKEFQIDIQQGIPSQLPENIALDKTLNHAPKRKDILSADEKKLAVQNALRYFPATFHSVLAKEFLYELNTDRKSVV